MTNYLILGTAGHIDHGKTSLIRALTGIDTDRLPEEKRRGITIELGFAYLDVGPHRFGIVDVPGHERFIRQMLAGATGMDLAILVVSAAESINAQTREHLDILKLLQVPEGFVVLTKSDLVERQWLELVRDEVAALVAGSFLEGKPILAASAVTGDGLAEILAHLRAVGDRLAESGRTNADEPFRMAIDRVFAVAGHGTVVTGSVNRGQTRVGDELIIEPGGHGVRVRGLQNHDDAVAMVQRGQRAAVNLAGIHHDQIHRGHELAAPGYLVPSRFFLAQIDVLGTAGRPLRDRQRVMVHLGTSEIESVVRLLDGAPASPGTRAIVQLHLATPAVATWGQPLILRGQSPQTTLGGGRVLHPAARRISRRHADELAVVPKLASENPAERASASVFLGSLGNWKPDELRRTAGISDHASTLRAMIDSGLVVAIDSSPHRTIWVHPLALDRLQHSALHLLERFHKLEPLATGLARGKVESRLARGAPAEVVAHAINKLVAKGQIVNRAGNLALAGHGPKLSAGESNVLSQLLETMRRGGLEPISIAEFRNSLSKNKDSVSQLVELAIQQGQLVRLSADIVLHADAVQAARDKLHDLMRGGQAATVSQIRTHLGSSRKYIVPLCEHFDATGVTRRQGDERVLADPTK